MMHWMYFQTDRTQRHWWTIMTSYHALVIAMVVLFVGEGQSLNPCEVHPFFLTLKAYSDVLILNKIVFYAKHDNKKQSYASS